MTEKVDPLQATSLGEAAALQRIHKALFGGDALVALGRYEIREELGHGAFGKVYRARDPQLDRDVALKVLVPDSSSPAEHAELLREARVMAALGHPNIVAVYDAGVVEEGSAGAARVFIAMELVAGQSLRAWLATPRAPAAVIDVLAQVGRGLSAAHAAGVVHRDLKPDNILVGDDGRARVVDFGLARHALRPDSDGDPEVPDALALARTSVAGAIVGTPAYMAPEQLDGAIADVRTDQFAFCVTAWEALHGRRPFEGHSLRELREAMRRPFHAPRTSGVPRRVQHAIARGLSRDPAARYGSLAELVAQLEVPRRRWLPIASAATALGLAIGWFARPHGVEPAADPCPRRADELTGIWDADRAARLRSVFAATHAPYAPDVAARVTAQLERATGAWLDANQEVCRASVVRHDRGPETAERQLACLRDWRRSLRATLDVLVAADATVVQGAVRALDELPDLARCRDVDALATTPAWPADPAARARIEAALDSIAGARAAVVAGRASEALGVIDAVQRDTAGLRFTPLAVAIGLVRADASIAAGRLDDALAAARGAFDLATATGDRRASAESTVAIVRLGALDMRRAPEALTWVQTGRTILAQLDQPHELDARLTTAEGSVLLAAADTARAEVALARAVALLRSIDPDHPRLGPTLAQLGTSALGRRDLPAARAFLDEALARTRATLGPHHPDVATVLLDQALAAAAAGRYVEAGAVTEQARAILVASDGPDHPALVRVLGIQGLHATARGDLAAADRAYAEAARIVAIAWGAGHPMGAQLALLRADVLRRLGRAREAVELATPARDLVATTADARDLGLAYADATLARAIADASPRERSAALDRARGAAARCVAPGPALPAGPCAIVLQVLGELATGTEAAQALDAASRAIEAGASDPVRLAEVRFARAQLLVAREPAAARDLAARAARELPAEGDRALAARIAAWRTAREE